jgi:hypothetical protein
MTWNGPALERVAEQSFRECMQILSDRKIPIAITDPKWNWPTSPSPRDIVDHGQLRLSQHPVEFSTPVTAVFRNSAAYALAVHEGYTTRHGFTAPARPWMTRTLEEFNLPTSFAALYKVYAGSLP